MRELREVPEELEGLERALSDTYFCNFSMFQSLPDIWAIDQLFPIMPIHRLDEEPTRRAVLADITCDSDGKIDHFIDRRDVKHVLELHPVNGQDYYLGIFLVGAYQEILGDLHNLFGDTNTVHVSLAAGGGYQIEHVVTGDTVTDVLKYVSYAREDLVARVRRFAELAVRANRMTLEETRSMLRMYEEGLAGYTYLDALDADARTLGRGGQGDRAAAMESLRSVQGSGSPARSTRRCRRWRAASSGRRSCASPRRSGRSRPRGATICNLTVGDFDPAQFPVPAALLDGVRAALAAGHTNYPPSDGVLALREAVARYYARGLGLTYPVESVLITGGARPLLYGSYRTVLDPGDVVVYPVPSWNNNHYAYLCGARAVELPGAGRRELLPDAPTSCARTWRTARLLLHQLAAQPDRHGRSIPRCCGRSASWSSRRTAAAQGGRRRGQGAVALLRPGLLAADVRRRARTRRRPRSAPTSRPTRSCSTRRRRASPPPGCASAGR